MKKLTIIIAFLIIITGCGDENPVEIVTGGEDSDNYDIELLSKAEEDYIYSNGIDSTGNSPDGDYEASFSVNVIKNSYDRVTVYSVLAQAVFNDLDSPVFAPSGRFLGYKTFDVRRVLFNNRTSVERPLVRRFLSGNTIQDTLLGPSYVVSKRGFGISQKPIFEFGSTIDINIIKNDFSTLQTTIRIPEEINASVSTEGSTANDFRALLNWNGIRQDKIQIILYGVLKENDEKYPLYKLTTADDGRLLIPNNLFRNLPFERFRAFVYTFLREVKREENGTGNNDLYFAANSIHNIGVPLTE